jgi:hypothetical protein
MASTAADRGWGPGWPTDNRRKCGWAVGGGVRLLVRAEIVELVSILLEQTVRGGYQLDAVADDWGYASRPIRGTSTPSNHSWGLAIDLNATSNPMGSTLVTDMPAWMVGMWTRVRVPVGWRLPGPQGRDALRVHGPPIRRGPRHDYRSASRRATLDHDGR